MRKFIAKVRHHQHQRATLRHLESYSDHLLADVGITRADIRILRYGNPL